MMMTGRWGQSKPIVTWIEPVEVIKTLLLHPELRNPAAFTYGPSFLQSNSLQTIQLSHSAWFHRAQATVGREHLVLAIITNADGASTTKHKETTFLYLHIGNVTAPYGFRSDMIKLIAIIPELDRKTCLFAESEEEDFQRQKLRLFHQSIDIIFENFHKAGRE